MQALVVELAPAARDVKVVEVVAAHPHDTFDASGHDRKHTCRELYSRIYTGTACIVVHIHRIHVSCIPDHILCFQPTADHNHPHRIHCIGTAYKP